MKLNIEHPKYATIFLISIAIGFAWFTKYKFFGLFLFVTGLVTYAYSVKIVYCTLINEGKERFLKLLRMDFDSLSADEIVELDKFISNYTYLSPISDRLPADVGDYKLLAFSKNKKSMQSFLDSKDEWLISSIKAST